MNNVMKGLLVVGMIAATGCAGYPTGFLYNGTTTPHPATRVNSDGANKGATKDGEACATGILGIAAWGDAGTDAAKKAGGIAEIDSIEFRDMDILGIYHVGCTQVHGK